jgi:DNA-binding transcriptional MerR regulator
MNGEGGPKKTYYSISEVCTMTGLEPHVLRYWESEFPQLHPKKNRAGNRAYRDKDIDIISYIKHLLYDEQYTIPGARKKCAETHGTGDEEQAPETALPQPQPDDGQSLLSFVERKQIVRALRDIVAVLKSM